MSARWDLIIPAALLLCLAVLCASVAWDAAKETIRAALDDLARPYVYDPDDCRSEDEQAADHRRQA